MRIASRLAPHLRHARMKVAARGESRYSLSAFEAVAGARDWRAGDLVLDVGANDGRTVRRLHRHLPVPPRILAFEPVSATFERLEAEAARFPEVTCHKLGLGDEAGPRTIHLGADPTLASLSERWSEGGGQEVIEVTTLDDFAESQELGPVALLKVDVEGHDLAVLRGARRLLGGGAVDLVLVEAALELDRGEASLPDMQDELVRSGYHLVELLNLCHRRGPNARRGRLVYADALFARD